MRSITRDGGGGARKKYYRVFVLRANVTAVPATENPRVGGSIPPLATTPPCRRFADPGTEKPEATRIH